MKITNKISLVASGDLSLSLTHPSDGNAYLIDCGDESVLIDTSTGLDIENVIKNIRNDMTSPLKHILITHHHADHIGGVTKLKEEFGAKVYVPAKEAESIRRGDDVGTGLAIARNAGYYPEDYHLEPCEIDGLLSAGDLLNISGTDIVVCDGAGHSLGGLCFYFPKEKMMFVGDLLMHGGRINLQNIPGANLENYSNSVQGLAEFDVDMFFSGHGCFSLRNGGLHIKNAADQFRKLSVPANFI